MLSPVKWKRAMAWKSKILSKMRCGRWARKCAGSSTALPVICCGRLLGRLDWEGTREEYEPIFFEGVVSC